MWKKLEVTLKFENKLCGSVPLNPDIIEPWLSARMPNTKPNGARSMESNVKEVMSTMAVEEENAEIADRITLGFQKVGNGLVMRGGTVKAHLKDCSRIVSSMIIGKIKGERSLALRIINCVNVEEYWIPLSKQGKLIEEPDDVFEKAVHVMTMMGPRNALKRILYIERPQMKFNLVIALKQDGKPVVTVDELTSVFDYGAVHGYAGERGDGEGRYKFTIKEI